MTAATRVADWVTKLVGLDDAEHHGISFAKLVIAFLTYHVGHYISLSPAFTWQLVLVVLVLVAAAMGRPVLYKVIDLLKAKWSGASNDSTGVSITGDAAALLREMRKRSPLPNLWHDDESGSTVQSAAHSDAQSVTPSAP